MDALKTAASAPQLRPTSSPTQLPPPLPGTELPAAAPGDSVVLAQQDDGARGYVHLRTPQGADVQAWQARSGASYQTVTTEQGTQFQATLPAGLTDQPLQIDGFSTPQGTRAVAHLVDHPEQAVAAQVTADGKLMVSLSPNGPLALFDPASLDYGVATPSVSTPKGQDMVTTTPLQEVVHADGSHTIKANATVTEKAGGLSVGRMLIAGPLGMIPSAPEREVSYLQITDKGGQVTAAQVTEHQTVNPKAPASSDLLGQLSSALGSLGSSLSGPAHSETPVAVTKSAPGTYQVAGGSGDLLDHMKASLKNPLSLQSPLASWLKSRNQTAQNLTSFSANPVVLSSLGAAGGPATAAAVVAPFTSPQGIPTPPSLKP